MSTGTLYTLVIQDDFSSRTEVKQYIVPPGVDPEDLFREIADAFIQSPEGMAISMKEGEMTWSTLLDHIPSYVFSEADIQPIVGSSLYPLTVIDSVTSVVDEDENLLSSEMLQAFNDHQRAAKLDAEKRALNNEQFKQEMLDAHYTEEQVDQVIGALTGTFDLLSIEAVRDYLRFNGMSEALDNDHAIMMAIEMALNIIIEGHGIEETRTAMAAAIDDDPDLRYINVGDEYAATLVQYEFDWYFTTLGDAVESIENMTPLAGKLNLTAPALDPLSEQSSKSSMSLGG